MRAAVQIKGLKELQAACKRMDVELGDKANTGMLKAIHHEVAQKVIDWAAPDMPGRLATMYKAANQAKGAIISNKPGTDYAGSNEFGGRIPNRGSKGAGAHKAASKHARGSRGTHQHKPPMGGKSSYFIYPAAEAHDREIRDYYDTEIAKRLDKVFGR